MECEEWSSPENKCRSGNNKHERDRPRECESYAANTYIIIFRRALTDKFERLLEVLLQVLLAGVRGGYLPVDDTPLLVVAGQLRGNVQHPGGAEGAQ